MRPGFRHEPHRLLFPVGAALACAGVVPWLLFSLGLQGLYAPIFDSIGFRAIFHPLVETQGFLTCFAVGFLFSWLPRNARFAPPSAWQIGAAVVAPVAVAVCAYLDRWAAVQLVWAALLVVVLHYVIAGARAARTPASAAEGLLWIVAGLLMGLCGGALGWLGAASGGELLRFHELGRGLLLQGMFTAIALGAFVAYGAYAAQPARRGFWLHALATALFFGSFAIGELLSARAGFALRAAITAVIIAGPLRLALGHVAAGLRRRLSTFALWTLPFGNAWIALEPAARRAGLHVIYLGCFAALALGLGLHAGTPPPIAGPLEQHRRDDRVAVALALLAVSLTARVLLEVEPSNFHIWLGTAAGSFVVSAAMFAALARS